MANTWERLSTIRSYEAVHNKVVFCRLLRPEVLRLKLYDETSEGGEFSYVAR